MATMSVYYEVKGELEFATAAEAIEACARLRRADPDESLFYFPAELLETMSPRDLIVVERTLVFDAADFWGGGETYYQTCTLIEELARGALSGSVRCQAGDGGPGTEISEYAAG